MSYRGRYTEYGDINTHTKTIQLISEIIQDRGDGKKIALEKMLEKSDFKLVHTCGARGHSIKQLLPNDN